MPHRLRWTESEMPKRFQPCSKKPASGLIPRLALLAFALSVIISCAEAPTGTQHASPTGFRVSGDSQVRFPGDELHHPLTIQLLDSEGKSSQTSGVAVTWSVLEGGGILGVQEDTTSVVGQARTSLTLGPDEGLHRVGVQVSSFPPYVFTATAVLPGPIAFVSNRNSQAGVAVFTMYEDGSWPVLTSTRFPLLDDAEEPAWSADRQSIAFVRRGDPYLRNLVIMDATGHNERFPGHYSDPAWSPDDDSIVGVYHSTVAWWLVIVDVHNYNNTTWILRGDGIHGAHWSPDGQSIVFTLGGEDGGSICVVNTDGSNLRCLTAGPHDLEPAWSPTGDRVLFARDPAAGGGIWVMNADGTAQEQLIGGDASSPSWSPEGTDFVVAIREGSQQDIWRVSLATGESINLTDGRGQNWDPVWRW